MADPQGEGSHTAVVADDDPQRRECIRKALAAHFGATSASASACALEDLPKKVRGKGHGTGDVVLVVIGRERTLRPEHTRYLTELSEELARTSRARRALIIVGDPTNSISEEALRLSAFYRVSQKPQNAAALGPEQDTQEAVNRAVEVARELRRLDAAAQSYCASLAGSENLRHLLGTAMCVVDQEFRIWHMDTVHLRMTGGAALDGEVCWVAFHKACHQGRPCRHCAVNEVFNPSTGSDKPDEPREIASQVENQMRFFLVAGEAVPDCKGTDEGVPDCDGKLAAEFSCDITDTPQANCMEPKQKLRLLLDAITSRGFAHARAWGYKETGESFTTLLLREYSGYDRKLPEVKLAGPNAKEEDRYFFNSIKVAKKPQIYSEDDLGPESLRGPLGKQDVTWWMEFPFVDRTGQPVGLLSVDNEDTAREKDIRHLPEVQQIANSVEGILAREWQEHLIQESLEALEHVLYERATVWDLLPDDMHTVMGRQCIGPGRDVRGVISSLYHEPFLYEAAVLHRMPQVLDRAEVVDRSAICRDYVADGAQALVFPLSRSGLAIGFLILSNPVYGKRLDQSDIARVQPLAEALASHLEQTQSLLDRFSNRAAPVLCVGGSAEGDPLPAEGDGIAFGIDKLIAKVRRETRSSHAVLRVLRRDRLEPDRQLGFRTGSDDDLLDVDIRDGTAASVRALRLGFPLVLSELQNDPNHRRFCEDEDCCGEQRQEEMKKLRSMIAVPVRDAIGVLGTLELFHAEDDRHFIEHKQQDWARALSLRLATLLRVRESLDSPNQAAVTPVPPRRC